MRLMQGLFVVIVGSEFALVLVCTLSKNAGSLGEALHRTRHEPIVEHLHCFGGSARHLPECGELAIRATDPTGTVVILLNGHDPTSQFLTLFVGASEIVERHAS